MFDVSSGEIIVLIGLGVTLIGRRDLPGASRAVGRQLGKVVGVLQGARARADRFAADNQLNALQNELRSGLRELDAVRGELAVAAGSGLVGRGLGSTVAGANAARRRGSAGAGAGAIGATAAQALPTTDTGTPANLMPSNPSIAAGQNYLAAARAAEASQTATSGPAAPASSPALASSPLELAPRSHAVAAVAEEEWERRGIGFTSRAERGTGRWEGAGRQGGDSPAAAAASAAGVTNVGGATLLSDLIQQSLVHDQYDRAVREQDEMLNRRAEKIRSQGRKQDHNAADHGGNKMS